MVRSRGLVIQVTGPISAQDNLGTDLSDDHPVSFRYDSSLASSDPQLKSPAGLTGAVRLDKDSQLQCTSCHDPHNDNFKNFFLRVDAVRGNLCVSCHDMLGWENSLHKNSIASWSGSPPNPWTHTTWRTVMDNACENCHNPHHASGKKRLLNYFLEPNNCAPCHNGHVAAKDIISEFNKLSAHPIYNFSNLHDPAEEALVTSGRHVVCSDCHNPHAVSGIVSGGVAGSISAVKGVEASGLAVNKINHEYELCFRCHADSNYAARNYVNRKFAENNTRMEFSPSNQSFHPVENIGKNPDMPSLISPLTASSLIKCTDCHNNNSTWPKGPHGSSYSPILERNLIFADHQTESLSAYALCYKCHDRNSILGNRSFPLHKRHVVGQLASCTVCHDPHGVKSSAHLINFDLNVVSASASGAISFVDNGRFHGSCTLKCHAYNHNNTSY